MDSLAPMPKAASTATRRRVRTLLLAFATVFLFALLFVQAAFNTLEWVVPTSAGETLILYALSTINFTAFLVLLMVLVRNLIKLRRERREMKLGARFKTRLVAFFIALSLLPVIFLFFATTGLINRSIEKWFSLPAEEILSNMWQIQKVYLNGEREGLRHTAVTLGRLLARAGAAEADPTLAAEAENQDLLLARLYGADGRLLAEQAGAEAASLNDQFQAAWEEARRAAARGAEFSAEVRAGEGEIYLVAGAPVPGAGAVVIAQRVSPELAERVIKVNQQQGEYDRLKNNKKAYRYNALLVLALITLLVLFIATWMALYVARSIAVPVQQLAQATKRVKGGDLSYRADVVGDDELAALALSFNEMTAEISASRRELQQSNGALDERRRYIEAVLQSLSAGVISLDEQHRVTTINAAAARLLRIEGAPAAGAALEGLLPEGQREELRRLVRRAARLRSVTREVHFQLANQAKLDAAVTVTALHDPQGQWRGTVIVIEDLTELIEAQRRAAWSEVARRMAHEIKNPLTPIRLSAERLAKNLLNGRAGRGRLEAREAELVRECTEMIGAEVATLQRMVDEFSSFARLPSAKLAAASLNEIVAGALRLYDERLDGIRLESRLAPGLPPVLADSEQIKRALVNLIDNAAEALGEVEGERRILVETREDAERETVELLVADTGPGIPAPDRERIFGPYFSTRKRGTGLGLPIVSHIVAEHQGRVRVEANLPRGARFVIELPTAAVSGQLSAVSSDLNSEPQFPGGGSG